MFLRWPFNQPPPTRWALNMTQTSLDLWISAQDQVLSHLPLFSSRKCTQTLSRQTQLSRTLDGSAISTTLYPHRYVSVLTCKDKAPAALEKLEAGSVIWVDCIVQLTHPLAPGQTEMTLARSPVPGSVLLERSQGTIPLQEMDVQFSLTIPAEENCFITYRPRLQMAVKSFTITADEWTLTQGWHLEMEET